MVAHGFTATVADPMASFAATYRPTRQEEASFIMSRRILFPSLVLLTGEAGVGETAAIRNRCAGLSRAPRARLHAVPRSPCSSPAPRSRP